MKSGTAAGRSKPLRADAERNRLQILDAARQLMQETGIEFAAHEVASRAGVGVATLYRRFPTRETLIEGVLAEPMRELEQDAQDAARHSDPGKAFFFYIRRLWEAQVRHPGLLQALSIHGFAETAQWRSNVSRTLRELLRAAQDVRAVRQDLSWQDIPFLVAAAEGLRRDALSLHAGPRQSERLLAVMLTGLSVQADPPLTGTPPAETTSLPDLTAFTRQELNRRARALSVGPISGMSRDELIARLNEAARSGDGRGQRDATLPPSGWK